MVELKRASPDAIRYACMNFHYARRIPVVQYGYNVYEGGQWCGVILYGSGATVNIGKEFGLGQGEVLELVRVALNGKQSTTSECVAKSLKALHRDCPYCKIVVSYADSNQGHTGIIYQATNWIYLGVRSLNRKPDYYIIHGMKIHPKSAYAKGWKQSLSWIREHVDPNATEFHGLPKHKYIYVFNKGLRKEWAAKRMPYPKKEKDAE